MAEVLTGYRRFHAFDADEARIGFAQSMGPHGYDLSLSRATARPSLLNVAEMGSLSLCYANHGMRMRVRSDVPMTTGKPYVKAMLVLGGQVAIRGSRDEIVARGQDAVILDCDAKIDLTFERGTELVMVRLDRIELESQLHRMLGRPLTSRLSLHAKLDTRGPAMRSWLSTVRMLCGDLDGPRGLSHRSLQKPIEHLLMGQLLTAVPPMGNDDLAALHQSTKTPATPGVIRRAEQVISDRAREPLTVAEIAQVVGISVRSLQEGFRRHLGTTPTARLLQARLDGVRSELSAADPQCHSVSQLAHDWGFAHLGRFAKTYRETFHESPSHTLRR